MTTTPEAQERLRLTALMERIAALPTIEEQRALYDTLSPEDQATMDARGLQRMWRSRRSMEAHARRRATRAAEFERMVTERMAADR